MAAQVQAKPHSSGEQIARSYESISPIYERLTALCTGGQNLATRLSQIEDMPPGSGSSTSASDRARKRSRPCVVVSR